MKCRGPNCGQAISFVTLRSSKMHPVDFGGDGKPEVYYLDAADRVTKPQLLVVTPDGALVRGRNAKAAEANVTRVEGWVSHFTTCPDSKAF